MTSAVSYTRIPGANDRIQVGLIGCGLRGRFVGSVFQKNPGAQVIALCDVWGRRIDQGRKEVADGPGFSDHRKLLEIKQLDAVCVETPDHWHVPIAIDAMKAGKDVYVEKPLTLRIEEGPEAVKTARLTGRICQVGTQRRSSEETARIKSELIDSGKFGRLLSARSWWYGNPVHILVAPPEMKTKPADLDWVRYLGQVKWREWDPQQYWNFRAYLDFGGGQITDLFTHWVDVMHWFSGEEIPCAAVAAGGVYTNKDGRTAPDTVHATLEYPGGFNASYDGAVATGYRASGAEFIGTKGRLLFDRKRWEFRGGDKEPPLYIPDAGDCTPAHVANFLDSVRTRKLPSADVAISHRSAQASHLANIAYKEQKRIRFDPGREEIITLRT